MSDEFNPVARSGSMREHFCSCGQLQSISSARWKRRGMGFFFKTRKDQDTSRYNTSSQNSASIAPRTPADTAPDLSAPPRIPTPRVSRGEEVVSSSSGSSEAPVSIGLRYSKSPSPQEFVKQKIILGREGDFYVNDPGKTVSRRHAQITWNKTKKRWQLLDISANGTFLNNDRIDPGMAVPLKNGDCLRLAHSMDIIVSMDTSIIDDGLPDGPPPELKQMCLTGANIRGWKVLNEIGRGGFSRVYVATDNIGRMICMKHVFNKKASRTSLENFVYQVNSDNPPLNSEHADKGLSVQENEYSLVSSFNFPNILHVFGKFSSNDHILILMEWINGPTLSQKIQDQRQIPVPEMIDYSLQIARILNYLHTLPRPVIYKDLKPINLIISNDGVVHLLDFGISQYYDPTRPDPNAYGSPGYSPPEQSERRTTPRSDLYSLGVTMFYALTGYPISKLSALTPPYHPIQFADVPARLDQIVATLTNPDQEQRYPNAAAVCKALESLRNSFHRNS